MSEPTPIELTPIEAPVIARVNVTPEQIGALITAIASADPAVITLPEGKAFSDIKQFHVVKHGNGSGMLHVTFS